MRLTAILMAGVLVLAACQPTPEEDIVIPTLAQLPGAETPGGDNPAVTAAAADATTQVVASPTQSDTPPPTVAPRDTLTPLPTSTPRATRTPNATLAAINTATAAAIAEVRLSTLTPTATTVAQAANLTPADDSPPATAVPQVAADIIVTEAQFQQVIDTLVLDTAAIEQVRVNFVPGGLEVQLTAPGEEALVTGQFTVEFVPTGGVVRFDLSEPEVNMPDVPEDYIAVVNGTFVPLLIEALDIVREQRVGDESDPESIVVTDREMLITLLVPES